MSTRQALALFDRQIISRAAVDAFLKLSPHKLVRNPVMFVTGVVAAVVTLILLRDIAVGAGNIAFTAQIAAWLWFTVLFANFAEAIAEGRGKAQADSLRKTRSLTVAKRLASPEAVTVTEVPATQLKVGDFVKCEAGDVIPGDGTIVLGVATVDESAITGESAPVIREAGGDFSAVTGGTRVLSDWLVVRVTVNPGETFVDRMIAMVEGADRRKTPNEIALGLLLLTMTLTFLIVVVTLPFIAGFVGARLDPLLLVALLQAYIFTILCCIYLNDALHLH